MSVLDIDKFMEEAIQFAIDRNPVWPFAAVIVDEHGRIICKASDAAHLSPLYHAESLAIHTLLDSSSEQPSGELNLFTTAEPEPLALSAIYWANITHDLAITNVYYGSTLKTINRLFRFGINVPAKEMLERSVGCNIALTGPVCESKCDDIFHTAHELQTELKAPHPARVTLSNSLDDFRQL